MAFALVACSLVSAVSAHAQDAADAEADVEDPTGDETYASDEDDLTAHDVLVVGARIADPDTTPQASTTFSADDLRRQQPLSINDVVRRAPGITVRDEDGMGLRPSIGFRGLLADRSRNVLLMEDGVPISSMPYDYPEVYVAPAIERMRSVEIVTGAAMLLYGPRTIGAAINFVTLAPPLQLTLIGDARIGTDGYGYGFASAGDTIGDLGVLVTAMFQHFDGPRHLNLNRLDTMARFAIDLHDAGELRIKLQWYDEGSTATNVGLTQAQFDHGVLDNFAQSDRSPVQRGAFQITHQVELSSDVTLATTGYFNLTERDWWRQDFLRVSPSAPLPYGAPVDRIVDYAGVVHAPGDPVAPDGSAIHFLSTSYGRIRQTMVMGIEPRLTAHYDLGWVRGEIIGGLRAHYERGTDDDQVAATPTAYSGATVSAQVRDVFALAAYVRPTLEFFDRHLEIAPGLRIESMFSSANQSLVATGGVPVDGNYVPVTGAAPTTSSTTNQIAVALPGVSGVVRLTHGDELSAFGGVHRGFVPPGIRDSILGTGRDTQLVPEYSWNYEGGVRGVPAPWLDFVGTIFAIDYETASLMPTEASTTPLSMVATNGPQRMWGFESRARFDPIRAAGLDFDLPLTIAYTHTSSRFGSPTIYMGATRAIDVSGNVVPYVPEHTLSARADFAHPIGIEAQASVDYMSFQFTDPLDTRDPGIDGVSGPIPARAIVNGRIAYTHAPWGITFYVDIRNALDTRYIASRAPAGINPGMTRQIFGGIRVQY
jgi:Fe(3+) dicitrate transport protein